MDATLKRPGQDHSSLAPNTKHTREVVSPLLASEERERSRSKFNGTYAAASVGAATPYRFKPKTEKMMMGQGDDVLGTPDLDYEAWRDLLRAMCGRYNPEGRRTSAGSHIRHQRNNGRGRSINNCLSVSSCDALYGV
jgi:hypothetical protein